MAKIQNTITLQDRMTPVLKQVQRSLQATVTAMAGVDKVSNSAFKKAQKEVDNLDREIQKFNNHLDELPAKANKAGNGFSGWQANLMGVSSLINIIKAGVDGISKLTGLSDQMTLTTARLNLMNDGLQTTEQLQQKIFQSAERSRGSYQATADAVSKMGILAGDAFGSNDELIMFMEQVNKQFAIAGTETQGQAAAMLQLTQAMGQGVLRGQELNSMFEQVPTMIQSIADYLDVPIGQIREMAGEGQITAEIVKNAMLATADETNAKFESMPKTFDNAFTTIQNNALMRMQPIFDRLSEIANSPEFQGMVQQIIEVIGTIVEWVMVAFDLMSTVFSFLATVLEPIAPLLWGILGAFVAYQVIVNGVAIATNVWAWAQLMLNAAMNANPIYLLISAMVGLIIMIYKLWTTNLDFKYGVLAIWNSILDGWDSVLLGFRIIGYGIMDIYSGIKEFAAMAMQTMVNDAIDKINILIDAANKIPFVNLSKMEVATFGDEVAAAEQAARNARGSDVEATRAANMQRASERASELAAKRAGEEAAIAEKASADATGGASGGLNVPTGAAVPKVDIGGGKLDKVGKIEDDVTISEEDIKLLKDVASLEYINKFTTLNPNVNVSFGDVHESADVSGLPGVIEKMVVDALATNLG